VDGALGANTKEALRGELSNHGVEAEAPSTSSSDPAPSPDSNRSVEVVSMLTVAAFGGYALWNQLST
jgi:hypothetical protein